MSLSPALDFSPDYNMAGVSKKLENEFISIQDRSMCVYARVRPLLQKEEESGYNACIAVIDEQTVRAVVPPNSVKYRTRNQDIIEDFKYTAAFGPEIGQFVFFEETMCNPMQDFIEGKNSLIFSYGITGSGKTYTFQGDDENPGIIILALRLFFASTEHQLSNRIFLKPDKFADINHLNDEEIEQEQKLKEQLLSMQQESGNFTGCSMAAKKSFAMSLCEVFSDNFKFEERETTLPIEEMSAAQSAMQMKELCKKCADQQSGSCSVWVSFVEIYNENVYDLLQPNINLRTRLTLGEDKNGDVYVKGLREVCVSNYEEALRLLDLGRKTLKIASTKLNYQSSRSHCIYTIKVVRLLDEDNMTVRINRLAFCDLAGSERPSKTQTTGLRLKEAGCINTSLLVLGRCLEQLRANQNLKDKRMIPFRESKLTRLFSGFFLGKGGAVMIANASPCDYTFDETLNVLKFSALAKELMINDSYMSMASSSLQSISNQWAKARPRISDASEGDRTIDLEYTAEEIQEKDELIEKLLDLADSLHQNLEKECKEKAELEFKIRQEVCNEYSEYSDALLENQRRILEEEKSSIIDIHKKRVAALEEMYEREIKNYKQQIEEYEAILDESRNTSANTEINSSAAQIFTDTSFVVVDEDHDEKQNISKSEICHAETLASESPSRLLKHYIEKNKNLEKEMNSLKEELELTKTELQKTALKGEMDAEVKYSELINKLEESASVTEEYKEEINLLKESCSSYASKIKRLQDEKIILEDDVSSLSAQLASTSLELEKLRQEKEELEKMLASASEDVLKYHAKVKSETEELHLQLQTANELLKEQKDKVEILGKEKITLEENIHKLEENLQEAVQTLTTEKKKTADLGKSVVALEDKCEEIENLKTKIDNLKQEKSILEEKFHELQQKLQEAVEALTVEKEEVDELKKKKSSLEENVHKLEQSLQEAVQTLTTEKEKAVDIGKSASALEEKREEVENLKTEIDKRNQEKSVLEENFRELQQNLREAVEALAVEKENVDELKKEKSSLEENVYKLEQSVQEAVQTLITEKEKAADIGKYAAALEEKDEEIENLKTEIEKLNQEKSILKENFHELQQNLKEAVEALAVEKEEVDELKKEKSSLEENVHKLEQSLQEAVQTLTTVKEKAADIEKNAAALEEKREEMESMNTEIRKLNQEKNVLEENFNELQQNLKEAVEALAVEKEEVAELKKEKNSLEENVHKLEQNLQEAVQTLAAEKEKTADLGKSAAALEEKHEEIANLKAELDKLKKEKSTLEEKFHELQQNIQESVEALAVEKEKVSDLRKNALNVKCEEFENVKQEISEEKEGTSLRLIDVLERCEITASRKIKDFHSNCIKHLEEVTDLRRQLNEKNASIEDMEKALCASQQQIKELTSKFKKQLTAEKDQHSAEIEAIMKLKQMTEKENIALKLKISQEEETRSNKRPSSSEEENKKSSRNSHKTDKENYAEAKNTRKTRRVLAEKQENAKSNMDDEISLSSDDDFDSRKETQMKKVSDKEKLPSKIPRKRKQEDEEFKLPVKRTSRRKLQEVEQENSPVRKLANAFNSKVRNLAQNVVAFSPRLTRGRKRLFNPETAPLSFASQNRK